MRQPDLIITLHRRSFRNLPSFINDLLSVVSLNHIPLVIHSFSDSETYITAQMPYSTFHNTEIMIIASHEVDGEFSCNEQLFELFLAIDFLKRAGAKTITVLMPYFPYSRQDYDKELHKAGFIDIVTRLLKTAGVNNVIVLDIHTPSVCDLLDLSVYSISLASWWAEIIRLHILQKQVLMPTTCVIASPDQGGKDRAEKIAHILGLPVALLTKDRYAPDESRAIALEGSVQGMDVVLVDDIIDTAQTACNAAALLKKNYARRIIGCFTHALFSGYALNLMSKSHFESVYITDSISSTRVMEQQSTLIKIFRIGSRIGNFLNTELFR